VRELTPPLSPPDGRETGLARHLLDVRAAERASFHMPAHRGSRGAPPAGVALFGAGTYDADVSEAGGFEYLHDPGAALSGAHHRAATLFGADRSWFLVNGATVGNLAAICATVGDGDAIVVARGSHRSVYAGIALSGARPIYLGAPPNRVLDGVFGIEVDDVRTALDAEPNVRAVHVTSPSFYGFTIDLAAVAELCAARRIPLIVDEAHGTHFALSPLLPPSALSLGADLVIHSPHKTLGSLTQSSLLHLRGDAVDADRVDGMLGMLQSSSPSALLLVSLDCAIAQMAAHGAALWGGAVASAEELRARVGAFDGVRAYGTEIVGTPGIAGFDPTKVVVDVAELGATGFAAAAWLRAHAGCNPEFADLRRLVFSVAVADDERDLTDLVAVLGELARNLPQARGGLPPSVLSTWPTAIPRAVMTPRRGAAAAAEAVDVADAVGRTSAEMVVPYPPGIPILVAGEEISPAVLSVVERCAREDVRLVGLADPTGRTIRCVQE
jgi:arginine/lysine/ornithine decarboxylase